MSRRQGSIWIAATLITLVVIGWLVYGYALSLPFFWDDIAHIGWMREHTLADVWRGPQWGAYYRPLPFSIWMTLQSLQGAHVPGTQHAVSWLVHVVNAGLVAGIFALQTQMRRPWVAGLAGIAFLLFPFSFQAIVPVNSLTHPLHTFITLLAVLVAQFSVTRNKPALTWLAAALAASAILAHENGILAPALAFWSVLMLPAGGSLQQRIRACVLPFAASIFVAFVLWRVSHAGNASFTLSLFNDARAPLSLAYFLQGLAFAPAALAVPLQHVMNAGDAVPLVFALGALFIIAWLALAWWLKAQRAALWALGWYVAAVLPASLLLDFSYIEQSPRLMYLASVGAACFLIAPLSGDSSSISKKVGMAIVTLLAGASLLWSIAFLQPRATLYLMLEQSIRNLGQSIDNTCDVNPQSQALAINFPEWFFVASPEYALGRDGIKTVAEQGGLSALYLANFKTERIIDAATLPDVQAPAQPYVSFGTQQTQEGLQPALRKAGAVLIGAFNGGTVRVRPAGCLLSQPRGSALTTFGNELALTQAKAHRNGSDVLIELDWQMQRPLQDDSTVFVHVVNGAGQLLAQVDGAPVAGISPLRLWQAGDAWRDMRHVSVLDSGPLRVLVGVYRSEDGQRLPAVDAQGNHLPEDAASFDVDMSESEP